ncbi:MAG: hypothetical protein ACRCYL_01890 [Kluyvera sp.]
MCILRSNKYKILLLIVGLTFGISILYFNYFRNQYLRVNCTASQYRMDLVDGQEFRTTIVMILHPEGEGEINYLGAFNDAEKREFAVSRTVHFNYTLRNDNELLMNSMRVVKTITDNTPDEMFNRKVMDLSASEHRLFVRKIYNAYMISTPYSAVGICVE